MRNSFVLISLVLTITTEIGNETLIIIESLGGTEEIGWLKAFEYQICANIQQKIDVLCLYKKPIFLLKWKQM